MLRLRCVSVRVLQACFRIGDYRFLSCRSSGGALLVRLQLYACLPLVISERLQWGQVVSPFAHQGASLVEKVSARVGSLGLVALVVS